MFFLQVNLNSSDSTKIVDFITERFWQHGDFWFNFLVGATGAVISFYAYREAHRAFGEARLAKVEATKAKDAAIRAGKTVKTQSIISDIMEIIKICSIRKDTNYEDSNNKLNDINIKIRNIMGLYRDELAERHMPLLEQIQTYSSQTLGEFGLLNADVAPIDIYIKIRPQISILQGHLAELKGVLENDLMTQNN
jgi:hypothetical protein